MSWTLVENEDQLPAPETGSISFNITTNVNVGDLIVFGVFVRSDLTSVPSGYETMSRQNGTSTQVTHMFWKVAEAGDIGTTVTFTQTSATERMQGRYAAFRTTASNWVIWPDTRESDAFDLEMYTAHESLLVHFMSNNFALVDEPNTFTSSSSTLVGSATEVDLRCGMAYRVEEEGYRTFNIESETSSGSKAHLMMGAYELTGSDPHYMNTPIFARIPDEPRLAVNAGNLMWKFSERGSGLTYFDGPLAPQPPGAIGRSGTGAAHGLEWGHRDEFCPEGAFTIEVWSKTANTLTGQHAIASKYITTGNQRSWAINWQDGEIQVLVSDDGATFTLVLSGTTYTPDTWHFIVLERDTSGLVRLYVDGAVVTSFSFPNALYKNTNAPVALNIYNNSRSNTGTHNTQLRFTNGVARYEGAHDVPTESLEYNFASDTITEERVSSASTLVLWGTPSESYTTSSGLLVLGRRASRRTIGIID